MCDMANDDEIRGDDSRSCYLQFQDFITSRGSSNFEESSNISISRTAWAELWIAQFCSNAEISGLRAQALIDFTNRICAGGEERLATYKSILKRIRSNRVYPQPHSVGTMKNQHVFRGVKKTFGGDENEEIIFR
jgi:hypothetical protein